MGSHWNQNRPLNSRLLREVLRFLALLPIFISIPLQANIHVNARGGELDASSWNEDQIYTLYGEWYFVGLELLTPEAFLRLQREGRPIPTTKIGLSFQQSAPERIKGPLGYGTYILRLKNLPPDTLFAMSEIAAYISARVYVFDSQGQGGQAPLFEMGHVTDDAAKAKSELTQRTIVPFQTAEQGDTYILIQVANHHHAWGGLWYPPTIGRSRPILEAGNSSMVANSIAFGIMIFIGFYNFVFFLYRPKDKGSLYLTLIAVTLLARTWIFTNYGFDYFGDGYWGVQLSLKVIYTTVFALPWASYNSVRGFFPGIAPRWMSQTLSLVSLVGVIFVLLTPSTIFGSVGNPLFIIGVIMGICCAYISVRAVIAREPGARTVLFGIGSIVFASFLEFMNALNLVQFGRNGMTFGMVVFAACQSHIISKRFAQALNQAEHLSLELHSEVQRQTRDIRSLLDNLNQGIFTLVAGSRNIGSLFSAYLRHIIGRDQIKGSTFSQLLLDHSDLNPDQKDRVEAALDASLGEDGIAFELNASNLLQELNYKNPSTGKIQQLEFDWSPIHDEHNRVEQILISVRDVTELRNLRKQARQREEDFEILQELVDVAEDRFGRFLQQALSFLEENRRIVAESFSSDSIQRLFINMHTLKGIARSYHFTHLAHVVHLSEETLSAIRKGQEAWDPVVLERDRQSVQAVCAHYEKIAREKLGWTDTGSILRLKKIQVEGMIQYVQHAATTNSRTDAITQLAALEKELLELRYHALNQVIDEASRGLDSLARSIGKLPPILEWKADSIILPEDSAAALHGVLTHLLRNSLDHGLEDPTERKAVGKAPQGTIRTHASIEDDAFQILFEDDGRGLDLQELQRRAQNPSALINDKARAELIFVPGLSTKQQTNDLSGRGVGMDAVRSILQGMGGEISIELTTKGRPGRRNFRLILRLPLACTIRPSIPSDKDIRLRNSPGF